MIDNCAYTAFRMQFEPGYDYTHDMEYEEKIYHKVLSTYEEYQVFATGKNIDIDVTEKDFEDNFVIITAIENTSMVGLTVSHIYTEGIELHIQLDSFPENIDYDENETCIFIKLPKYMKQEIVKVEDIRKSKISAEKNYNWNNTNITNQKEVTLEEAIKIAKQYAKKIATSNSLTRKYLNNYTKVYEVNKTETRPNNFWLIEDGIIERQLEVADFTRTVYEVILVKPDDDLEIERAFFYVDVYTGEVIAGMEMSD